PPAGRPERDGGGGARQEGGTAEGHGVVDGFYRKGIARVVKGGTATHLERQRASDDVDCPHDAMPIGGTGRLLNGHEIRHFSHAGFRQKAGHEDIGIWEIQLFSTLSRRVPWLDLEVSPLFSIE